MGVASGGTLVVRFEGGRVRVRDACRAKLNLGLAVCGVFRPRERGVDRTQWILDGNVDAGCAGPVPNAAAGDRGTITQRLTLKLDAADDAEDGLGVTRVGVGLPPEARSRDGEGLRDICGHTDCPICLPGSHRRCTRARNGPHRIADGQKACGRWPYGERGSWRVVEHGSLTDEKWLEARYRWVCVGEWLFVLFDARTSAPGL